MVIGPIDIEVVISRGAKTMESNGGSIEERFSQSRERIKALEKRSLDVSKVLGILENLEKKIDDTDPQKVEDALVKLESYLDRMENRLSKKRVRKVVVPKKEVDQDQKPEKEERPPEDGSPEDPKHSREEESAPEGIQEDAEEEQAQVDDVKEQKEEEEEAPSETAEVPDEQETQDEGIKEQKEEEEEAPSEIPEKPEEEKPVEEPVFNMEDHQKKLKHASSILKEVQNLGGDTSPILGHMGELKKAFRDQEIETFDNYLSIVMNWTGEYLSTLLKNSINSTSDTIQMMVDVHTALERGSDVEDIVKEMDEHLKESQDAGVERLREILDKMDKLRELGESRFQDLKTQAGTVIEEGSSRVLAFLDDIEDEAVSKQFREGLDSVREAHKNDQFVVAINNLKDIEEKVSAHINKSKTDKIETILRSVEPLMESIKKEIGDEGGDYKDLKEKQDQIVEISKTESDKALVLVEELLDKASSLSADLEEKRMEHLQQRIRDEKQRASEASSILDTAPIINIIENAERILLEGSLDKASDMLEKANIAFENLMIKKQREEIKDKLKRYESRSEEFAGIGLDVTPLNEPLTEAWNALESGDKAVLDQRIQDIEKKLSFLRTEDLKLKYQKILIKVVNSLKDIKEEEEDAKEMESRLDEVKTLYMDRKFQEAIEAATDLENSISQIKLGGVLEERFNKVRETLNEAEGLLVDVSKPKERLKEAEALGKKGENSEALDILVEVQVEIEDIMTKRTFSFIQKEIEELVNECDTYSVEPGDPEALINKAYGLADDEKYREAMDMLTGFRDKLARKLKRKKVESQLDMLKAKIKEARPLKINVSSSKAAQTKARVLVDAGDVEKAFDLLDSRTKELTQEIDDRRKARDKLDKLRGRLLAQEGKLSRLVKSSVDIGDLDGDVTLIRDMIDNMKPDEAEIAINDLESSINDLLRTKPDTPRYQEEVAADMLDTLKKKEPQQRRLSIESKPEKVPMEPPKTSHEIPISPEKARSELFILIPKIKVEKTRLNSKGIDTEMYNKDIASIQKLVMERKYIEALEMAKDCYSRMTS